MANATDKIISLIKRDSERLLKLYFPNDDGPQAGLLINQLIAEEAISRDFTYTITALSDDPHIDLTEVQGRMVCVELRRQDEGRRYFNGYCFEFALLRIENSLAVYQMVLRPWLALFRMRSNHRLFHHKSIVEQSKLIFCETGLASHEFVLADLDPPRTFSCQYDETDYNYLHRRWEEMGWHYWYEHSLHGHKLMIGDSSQAAKAIDGETRVAYHHDGGNNKDDKIREWGARRQLVSGRVGFSSFDFKKPSPAESWNISNNEQGEVHKFEVYQYQDLYGFSDPAHGNKLTQKRMEQIDAASREYRARGNQRAMQPGRWFKLQQDKLGQSYEGNEDYDEFLILQVRHVMDNNYLNSAGEQAGYQNSLVCAPRKLPWRPAPGLNSSAVKIRGVDTATVVGPPGEDIYTDEFGRIRIQFHWDRQGNDDQRSSAWVRVASGWAGAENGTISLPRIGSEVLVQWLGGSPDRPIVTGSVHNARKMPPWKLPTQQALSGWRSRELGSASGNKAGGRSNHLIFDDTNAKIQAQLKSDHQHSQLSLGSITRIEDNAGRKDARGEGWELATNAWGVARAGMGMLLTTEARKNAVSHIKDMGETAARLKDAYGVHEKLKEAAIKYGAQEKKNQQGSVTDALKAQHEAVRGKGQGEFPELSEPHLVLASPAGIETTSAKSSHFASDQHTALTAGKNLSLAAGDSLYASISKTLRLFVKRAGMKLIAAGGDIDIKALNENLNLLAKLNITQSANRITINAKEEVVINGAGSYVKFSAGGIEHGTSGTFVAHAKTHSFVPPKNLEALRQEEFEKNLPKKFSQKLFVDEALWKLESGVRAVKYKVFSESMGVLGSGVLDAMGKSKPIFTDSNDPLQILVDINNGKWEQIFTERHEEISVPAESEVVVFDFEEHGQENADKGEAGDDILSA